MGLRLSDGAIESYRTEGYHFPVPVFDAKEVAHLRGQISRTEALLGGPIVGKWNQKPHLLFPWLADLIRDPRILDPVQDLLGPDLLCWSAGFFNKAPGDGAFVSWHQDATYWGLSEPDVLTAWVAFTPSTREAGCMRVLPGSHSAPVPHVDSFAKENMLSRGQEAAVAINEAAVIDFVLQPGDMSLHHVLLVHGSEKNRSDHPRIGLAIRYMPTRLRQVNGERDSATLVRGQDRFGHFEHEPRPEADLHPDALARHAAIIERQMSILYQGASDQGRRV